MARKHDIALAGLVAPAHYLSFPTYRSFNFSLLVGKHDSRHADFILAHANVVGSLVVAFSRRSGHIDHC